MAPTRHRGRSRRRQREAAKRIAIVVVGKVTEHRYFTDLKSSECSSPSISVSVKDKDPLRQIRKAIEKRESGSFDEVWLVLDVDYFSQAGVEDSVKEAADANVKTAISNPCFEYWLILHFETYTRYIAKPKDAERYLRHAWVPQYRKSNPCVDKFHDHHDEAVDRGRERSKQVSGWKDNPSTEVWELVDSILTEQRKRRKR